ncbi:GntR family transcriptional regulator [Murinocardiopsis flavida]|uniref:GntR family transcriptional regulator n=1 Tax=Murinocardiopsis flavida TaxID=645275 RepID=A0A2P8CZV3_9ACTN|nr:GntR family transcriptional regulator [Murinocardiopsis flavida]
MVFAPLDDGAGRGEAVARRLAKAISLGLISDGEQLPSESELATALNVSTVTLREALSSLRSQGLVETRRGRGGGSFVRASPTALADRALARILESATTDLRELGDVHAAVSGAAARLAAERAAPDNVARLREVVDRFNAADSVEARRRLDGRYYIEVAAAAQSVRLTTQEFDIQAEVGAMAWIPARTALAPAAVAAAHHAAVAAIARRDAEQARALTERHVEALTQRLIEIHVDLARTAGGTRVP